MSEKNSSDSRHKADTNLANSVSSDSDVAVSKPQDDQAQTQYKALDLLSRRDHSEQELRIKLEAANFSGASIDGVIQGLADKGYLNDDNFAERYVEQRSAKGYGEVAIRQELKRRGIRSDQISAAIENADGDWLANALRLLEKKRKRYDNAADYAERRKEKMKLARFLQHRGFTSEQCHRAIDSL